MTKEQQIAKYGIEWYEEQRAKGRQRNRERRMNLEYREAERKYNRDKARERYANDSEYREARRAYSNAYAKDCYTNNIEFREAKKASSREYRKLPGYKERHNAYYRAYNKERYANDIEYREQRKESAKAYSQTSYVKDKRIDLIDNYELAKADNFKGWCMHHRLELHPDYSVRFTMESLIKLDLYYNRPPTELIWVTSSEHARMHIIGKKHEKGKA